MEFVTRRDNNPDQQTRRARKALGGMGTEKPLCAKVPNGGRMGSIPSKVGVFFGKADKMSLGWHWTRAPTSQKRKGAITGPFETKEKAVENAVQSLAARQAPNDEPAMSRPSSSETITERPFLLRSRTPRRRLDFWTSVRTECSTLLALRSGSRWDVTGRNGLGQRS
jgi:hypothetical protein